MKRWNTLKAVFAKSVLVLVRYRFNLVTGLMSQYVAFLVLFAGSRLLGGAGALNLGTSLEGLVVGYLVWIMAWQAFEDLATTVSSEAEMGTLEQLFLSPSGFAWVNGARLISNFVVDMVQWGALLLLMMATTGQWLHVDMLSLVPLGLVALAAPYGLGYMMAGLALIFKRIQKSFLILQFAMVGFIVVPVGGYAWARYAPLSLGSDLLRRVMVDGTRLWQLPAGDILTALAVGLGYFLLGLLAFRYCVKAAKERGMLGQY